MDTTLYKAHATSITFYKDGSFKTKESNWRKALTEEEVIRNCEGRIDFLYKVYEFDVAQYTKWPDGIIRFEGHRNEKKSQCGRYLRAMSVRIDFTPKQ